MIVFVLNGCAIQNEMLALIAAALPPWSARGRTAKLTNDLNSHLWLCRLGRREGAPIECASGYFHMGKAHMKMI